MSELRLDGVDARYGASRVLQGVSLEVPTGAVVGLVGRNGAGKSTLLKSVMGLAPPTAGRVIFADENLAGLPPHAIARKGIAYVPEDRAVFPSLTVAENLMLAARRNGRGGGLDSVFAGFPALAARRRAGAGTLSGGEQQMLALARLMMMSPRCVLLDEPTQGLAPAAADQLANIVARLTAGGASVLLVEQNLAFASRLADSLAVIGKGQIRWRGAPDALDGAGEIKRVWLGV